MEAPCPGSHNRCKLAAAPPAAPTHLNSAFSAPRIWMVEAGALARLMSEPTWAMRRAPTSSPTSTVRLGATAAMRLLR